MTDGAEGFDMEHCLRRRRELEAIIGVQAAVASSLALDEVLDRALDATLAATAMEAGEIWLFDAADSRLRLARQRGCDGELFGERPEFALGEGIPGRVAQTAEPVVVPDLAADPRFLRRRVVAAGFTALAAVPLQAKGEVIGALDVATRHARPVTEDDLRLLTAIGAAVGMAAANARLYERLARATQQLEAMTGTLDARLNELERMQAKLAAFEPMGTTDRPSAPPAV